MNPIKVICIHIPNRVFLPYREENCVGITPQIGEVYDAWEFQGKMMRVQRANAKEIFPFFFLVETYAFHHCFRSEKEVAL